MAAPCPATLSQFRIDKARLRASTRGPLYSQENLLMSETADIIIIGGGVMGASITWLNREPGS